MVAEAQEPVTCQDREAEVDSLRRACSGDCRFEHTQALRVEFSCQIEDAERTARLLALAINFEHDVYWVDAFIELLDPLPEDEEWVRRYWLERMTQDGRLPPALRESLVAQVRRIARLERREVHKTITWYSDMARDYGLDPRLVVQHPFEPVESWLDADS